MESLVHFIYTSVASPDFTQAQLQALLKTCRLHNNKKHISGLLLFHSGTFIQWVEGFESELAVLRDKIIADERHQEMIQIEYGPISQRYFSEWSMGYLETGSDFSLTNTSFSQKDLADLARVKTMPWLAVDVLFRQASYFRERQFKGSSTALINPLEPLFP